MNTPEDMLGWGRPASHLKAWRLLSPPKYRKKGAFYKVPILSHIAKKRKNQHFVKNFAKLDVTGIQVTGVVFITSQRNLQSDKNNLRYLPLPAEEATFFFLDSASSTASTAEM